MTDALAKDCLQADRRPAGLIGPTHERAMRAMVALNAALNLDVTPTIVPGSPNRRVSGTTARFTQLGTTT